MIYLRINDRDLSAYTRVQHEDGLTPYSQYSEPQFAGSTAFTEGGRHIGDSLGNREVVVPLILEADDRASLHQLIADIENELHRGARVEFATDDADARTYFDLERGRLDLEYQFFLSVHSLIRCVLHLWVRPHAHTGTYRRIAAESAASGALRVLPATGILGDTAALGRLSVRVGSRVASSGRVIAYGAHKSASYNPYRGPSGWTGASAADFMPQASSVLAGASGRLGSQLLSIPVSPTGASGVAARVYMAPVVAHQGRSRVFAVLSNGLSAPMPMYAKDRFGAALGPTQLATQNATGRHQLLDLGEIQVPAHASGIGVPTQYLDLYAGGASGAAIIASPALRLDALLMLPLDEAPGLLRTPGAGGQALLHSHDFTSPWEGELPWTRIAGRIEQFIGIGYFAKSDNGGVRANASGFYALASGTRYRDVISSIKLQMSGYGGAASAAVASAAVELWLKQINASQGMFARLEMSPSAALRIIAATGAATVVLASAVGATVAAAASGFFNSEAVYLGALVQGNAMAAYVGRDARGEGAASVGVTDGFFTNSGWPALRGNAGSNISEVLLLDDFTYSSLGAGASDIAPREWFRMEAHPEARAYQGNASIFLGDMAAHLRGQHPRLPLTGSPGASSPAKLVLFTGALDDFLGNDVVDVELDILERFTFLR